MKTKTEGSFIYDIKNDSYIFRIVIPCDNHDRITFKSKAEEVSYYKRKIEKMTSAFADSDALDGNFEIVTGQPIHPPE